MTEQRWLCGPCAASMWSPRDHIRMVVEGRREEVAHGRVLELAQEGVEFVSASGQSFYPLALTQIDGVLLCGFHAYEKLTTDLRHPGMGYLQPRSRNW